MFVFDRQDALKSWKQIYENMWTILEPISDINSIPDDTLKELMGAAFIIDFLQDKDDLDIDILDSSHQDFHTSFYNIYAPRIEREIIERNTQGDFPDVDPYCEARLIDNRERAHAVNDVMKAQKYHQSMFNTFFGDH